MLDLIAVMYTYCSIMMSQPDISAAEAADKAITQVYTQPAAAVQNHAQKEDNPPQENKAINYVEELKKLGYYKEESEDKDLDIRNAVIHFQCDHNLETDGIWGGASMGTLRKRLGDTSFAYPDSVSQAPSNEKWITINKTKRILTLYDGKNAGKKYPVAVGNPPSLTPDGKFTIVVKVVNPDWGGGGYAKPIKGGIPENPLGYRWMGLSVGGGGDYGIHGNNNPWSIGTDASHGCVRMLNADVESLFESIPVGTHVWIGTEKQLSEWGVSQPEYVRK